MASEHGISSAVYGGLAIVASLASKQFELLRHPQSGHVLDLAERLGILREPQSGATPEISSTTLLTITDGWLITALAVFAAYLAGAALVFALWAEYRQEDSLYLGVGFLCGGMALFLLQPVAGVLVVAVGTAAILEIRRRSDS